MSGLAWIEEVRSHYASSGMAGRLVPGQRPAVLVVDLQRGFTAADGPVRADLDGAVEATRAVLDAARRAELPVIFTTIAFHAAEVDRLLWLRKMPAMRELVGGSAWVEIDKRLARRPEEPLVVKQTASAFSGTRLDGRLRALGADSLIVCGGTTSGCIRATAIDACAAEWPTFVPRECVGDRAAPAHEANLLDIDAKYADVVAVEDALAMAEAARR